MDFIYGQENLRDAIARATLEYKESSIKRDIHHMEIHRRVKRITGHSITHYKLLKTLVDMTHKGDLIKTDPKGKRGSKVFYELTARAKEKYRLRILGPGEKTRRRRSLYQLLIYFEVYKRGPLLTKTHLSKFLKQIGSSIKDLEKEKDVNILANTHGIYFKPIKGVDIMGIILYDKRTKSDRMFYYTLLPGFSVEELVLYLQLFKNKTEPRPFSASIALIPYARYIHLSKKEITESISSLYKHGLIKTINPIIQDEKRFVLADDRFRYLSYYIWAIQIVDINLLFARLIFKRPTDKEKEYLSLYLGERLAAKVLIRAYDIRRQSKKEKVNDDRDRETIKSLEREREFLVKELMERYENTIKENEVVHEIMEGVCYSPLLSMKE